MRTKKLIALLLTIVMTSTIFVGCSGSSSATQDVSETESSEVTSVPSSEEATAETPSGEKTKIAFYVASDMDVQVDAEIAAFNAQSTEYEVEKHVIANNDYDNKIKVMLAGGSDEIDCLWIRTPAQVKQYMANGVLEDLSSSAEASGVDLSSIINTSLAAVSGEKSDFYGLPVTGSCWMLFYNKELFDKAGVDYPINLTWDEYCDLAAKLTQTGDDGTQYYGGICPLWTMNLGATCVDEYLTDDAPLTRTAEYLQILHRMYVDDASHVSVEEMSAGTFDINSYFSAGNIYMMINGDWEFRLLDTDFEYAAAPLPIFKDAEEGTSVGQSAYLCMPTSCKNKQGAYEFIEYYTTSSEGTTIIAKGHDVPSYSTPEALEAYKKEITADGVDYRFSAKIHDEQGLNDNYSAIDSAFKEETQLYLLDEESLDDAMNNFYELRNQIVEDSK